MHVHRDPAAVIDDRDRPVDVERDVDVLAVASERLVNVNEVLTAPLSSLSTFGLDSYPQGYLSLYDPAACVLRREVRKQLVQSAAPGEASLEAAAHPAAVPYLYFVSRNDGTHAFATTLDEHNRNVFEYQIKYFRERRQK